MTLEDPQPRLIRPADWRTQPWKNGGGVTHEVLRVDDAGGMLWRVSVAELGRDGPFSEFPGVDRIIALLEGKGCRLTPPGLPVVELTRPLALYGFAGETPITCALVDGAVRDFNVMTRRGAMCAEVHAKGRAAAGLPGARSPDLRLLFVATGELEVTLPSKTLRLATHEALLAAGDAAARWQGAGEWLEVRLWRAT